MLAFFVLLGLAGQAVFARDVFVLLSGGDSPQENNYSQYLQARAVAMFFEEKYPASSVWTFFGAGNVDGEKPVFGDVRREVRRDGLTLDSWLPGSVLHNHPATREMILRTFREEILPAVAEGGTLFLFVGDHGSQTRGSNSESIINLWSLERDPRNERGWRSHDNETLGVSEFRSLLAKGLGKGRAVFCMTQCHAGGFHYLAMPRQMTPNPKWFTKLPAWAAPKPQTLFPRIAGFTATDERSQAAGCDANPDPEKWAGYERFVPENLFGVNLFTLERTGRGLTSFAEAHVAATLVDQTIDKPYSTSEQYLERWASLIETRLAKETNLTEKTKKLVASYQRKVDGATSKPSDRALRQKQAIFRRFIETLITQNPTVKEVLLAGTRRDLEQIITPGRRSAVNDPTPKPEESPAADQPRRGRRGVGAMKESRKLWNEILRPAWQAAVETRQTTGLPASALEFEKSLISLEAGGRDLFFGAGRSRVHEEAFWRSGYSNPETIDPAKAEAVMRWALERRAKILEWGKSSRDESVRSAAEKIFQSRPPRPAAAGSPTRTPSSAEPISREIAAARTLFYRRVLAAWEFLLEANERPALAKLHELIELERTPLPAAKK